MILFNQKEYFLEPILYNDIFFLFNILEFLQQLDRHAGQLQLYALVPTDRPDRDDDIEEPQRCVIAEYAHSLGLSRSQGDRVSDEFIFGTILYKWSYAGICFKVWLNTEMKWWRTTLKLLSRIFKSPYLKLQELHLSQHNSSR